MKLSLYLKISGLLNLTVKGSSVIIGLLTTRMALNVWSESKFGFWAVLTSFTLFLTYADFGISNSLQNIISSNRKCQDGSVVRRAIQNSFFLTLVISVIVAVTLQCLDVFQILGLNSSVVGLSEVEFRSVIKVIIFVTSLNILFGPVQKIFEGFQVGYKYSILLILGNILSFSFFYVGIKLNVEFSLLFFLYASGVIFANIVGCLYLILRQYKSIITKFEFFDLGVIKQLLFSGIFFVVIQILSTLMLTVDNFLLMKFYGPKEIVSFELPRKLFMMTTIIISFVMPLWTKFSAALAEGNILWANEIFIKLFKWVLFSSVIFVILLLVLSEIIFNIWIGHEVELSTTILVGFALNAILMNLGGVCSVIFNTNVLVKFQLMYVVYMSLIGMILKLIIAYNNWPTWLLIYSYTITFSVFFLLPALRKLNAFFATANV